MKHFFLSLIILLGLTPILFSQQSPQNTEAYLKGLTSEIPALNEVVSLSVSNVSIQELVRGIANNSGLNINIDPKLEINVVNNFSNVKVIDILLFLAQNYNLNITNTGTILNLTQLEIRVQKETGILDNVQYDKSSQLVSFDFSNQVLDEVAKAITQKTGYNIVLSPGIGSEPISSYIQKMPFENAINKLAYSNNLGAEKSDDNSFILRKIEPVIQKAVGNQAERQEARQSITSRGAIQNRDATSGTEPIDIDFRIIGGDKLTITVEDAPIVEIIKTVSKQFGKAYLINGELQGKKTVQLKEVTYDVFLENILAFTDFTFRQKENIYIIDHANSDVFIESKVFKFQYRTITNIIEAIPQNLLLGIELVEFPELNSFLISGPHNKVKILEQFLSSIDKIVPVILIEVIIVDMTKSFNVSTGIEAGIGDQPIETGGKLFPGVDVQISSTTINDILSQFDGFGTKNIGVKSNVYATLKAMESQGILNVRSTPQLSTLNGHEASLSIGNTEYYLEEQSNVIGTQNPQLATSQVYKPVNAELAITINPIVSGDDQVTMQIDVQQSDFTARISQFAPPGSVSRTFQSVIRVKNQETIILGGLEEKQVSDSSTGVPLLSRIPVIKWFFSSRTKENSKSKLNIFIKPTIIN